ncbi:hypothetical protein ABZW67_24560 [Streptomyces rubiginosohelvolus]|uniref:hypothetical protein n=1 Tax=Streptomyces rubiginosohelvolus TaxID=67362 RepID=UPI0033BDB467
MVAGKTRPLRSGVRASDGRETARTHCPLAGRIGLTVGVCAFGRGASTSPATSSPPPEPANASAPTAPPGENPPASPRRSANDRGLPVATAGSTASGYLAYWLGSVSAHRLRENTHTRCTACVNRYLTPGLGKKQLTKFTATDIRSWLNQFRTTRLCCSRGIDAGRDHAHCCATGSTAASCSRRWRLPTSIPCSARPEARCSRGRDPAQRCP